LEDKRRFSRLEQNTPARQKVENSDFVEKTHSKDVSTGGLRLSTDSQLEVGTKLNVEVNIAGSARPYYAQGEVVWLKENEQSQNKKFDMGIRFLRIVTKEDLEGF